MRGAGRPAGHLQRAGGLPPTARTDGKARRRASPTPCRCRPTWSRSSSARSRPPTPVDVDGVPMRLVHVPGKGHLAGFGLEVGAFALRWFQRYYGIPYPSDKVDLVALPDFAAGAMENLGCITFRESVLLVDPATATQTEEQLVADVVAHELAHMWFGDLVTMRWWNGIWLNEAFATFMEVAACDAFRPGLEALGDVRARAHCRLRDRQPGQHPPGGVRGRLAGGRRRHVRRAHLREGRRPAAHAGAVPGRGALPRRHPPLPGQAQLREHRDVGPVGRARGHLRRAGPADHGQLDLAGRLPPRVGHALGRRHAPSSCGSAGSSSTRGRRGPTRDPLGHPGAGPPGRRAAPRRKPKVLLDGDELRAPAARSRGGGRRQQRWPRLLPRGLRRPAPGPPGRGRAARAVHASSATAWSTTRGRRWWLERPRRRRSCELARGFGDEPDVAVWRTLVAGLGWCDRLLDGEPRERLREFVRDLVGPRLADLGWSATEGEDELAGELRGLLIRALAVLGDDADAAAARRRAVRAPAGRTRPRSTRRWSRQW